MRRLELTPDEHALLCDALTRQHRQTLAPELAELVRTVRAAPRVVAYVVSVELPTRTQKSGGEETPPPPARHVASSQVGAPEGAETPPPVGAAAGL